MAPVSPPGPLGLIGLGLLGGAVAERLLEVGFAVIGFDLVAERRERLVGLGGRAADRASTVAADSACLLLCLPDSRAVAAVLGEVRPALRPGVVVVDLTTGDPERTAAIGADLAAHGVPYLDATVSGSSEQARAGDVVLMVGGEAVTFAACRGLLERLGREVFPVGGWGAGARMKLVTNLVLGLNRAVLAEGLAYARAVGVDPAEALRVLQAGAAASRVMDTKGAKMLAGDFAPQARLAQHLKDVELILTEGERVGACLPLSRLHRELLERLVADGLGGLDNAAILRAFERP